MRAEDDEQVEVGRVLWEAQEKRVHAVNRELNGVPYGALSCAWDEAQLQCWVWGSPPPPYSWAQHLCGTGTEEGWSVALGGLAGTVRARCGYWGPRPTRKQQQSSRANQGEW